MTTIHPNVPAATQTWSESQTLHVASPYSNPFRFNTRRTNMNNFIQHMHTTKNVVLHVGELAYGDRDFEVSGTGTLLKPEEIQQFRTGSELFHKENIGNEIIEGFPADWEYGAIVDGDFTFTRSDWALEAIHQLQHYDFVQLFSTYADLSAEKFGGSRVTRTNISFAANYIESGFKMPTGVNPGGWGMKPGADNQIMAIGSDWGTTASLGKPGWVSVGATGGGWAFRRSAFETVGGLLDQCILGHADWFMAFGLIGEKAPDMHDDKYHPRYTALIDAWQNRAALLKRNIGFVDQYAIHNFHGSKKNRGYSTRDQILARWQFDPVNDIRRNAQGIYELAGNKPGLRDDIRQYFIARDEDNPNQ